MTAAVIDLDERLNSVSARTKATVQAVKGYRGMTDADIGDVVGWSRSKVQSYASGPTKFTDQALAAFAYALRVPMHILLFDKDDALRWILDNPTGDPDGPPDGSSVLYPPWDSNPEPAD